MSELKPYDFAKIVETLNEEIDDKFFDKNLHEEELTGYIYFDYRTNGEQHSISFMDACLWSSEDDLRECIDDEEDEYEPLEPFLRREANKLLGLLKELGEFNEDKK